MSSDIERSGKIATFYDDLKAIHKMLLEVQRTMDTDGCYNPYNRVAEALCNTILSARSLLASEIGC